MFISDRYQQAEREPYEEIARADRLRYEDACDVRDKAVLLQQEERRAKNSLLAADISDDTYTRRGELRVKQPLTKAEIKASVAAELPALELLSGE